MEVRHFCQQLHRGNVRFIEAFCSPPESVVLTALEWLQLSALIKPLELLDRTFLDRCVGQAMGGIIHKRRVSGRLAIRDDANLVKFCDSLRLGLIPYHDIICIYMYLCIIVCCIMLNLQ